MTAPNQIWLGAVIYIAHLRFVMKKLLLMLAATLSCFKAQADYEPTLLPELIDSSDLIFYGEIVAIREGSVIAKTLEVIKGANPRSRIVIDKFENWTCATRFAQYRIGQKEFFFLKRKRGINRFFALVAANEGEMPVVNQNVYYQSQYLSIDEHPHLSKVYGGGVHGYIYDKSKFIAAVKFYMGHHSDIRTNIIHNQARIDTTQNIILLRIFAELQVNSR